MNIKVKLDGRQRLFFLRKTFNLNSLHRHDCMPKMTCKEPNLFGIQLDSTTPVTPRTLGFFASKGVQVIQDPTNNTVTLDSGNKKPSFTANEVQSFLSSKV